MGFDQDRRTVEEIVRSLDDQERLAALYRDIPALEACGRRSTSSMRRTTRLCSAGLPC